MCTLDQLAIQSPEPHLDVNFFTILVGSLSKLHSMYPEKFTRWNAKECIKTVFIVMDFSGRHGRDKLNFDHGCTGRHHINDQSPFDERERRRTRLQEFVQIVELPSSEND